MVRSWSATARTGISRHGAAVGAIFLGSSSTTAYVRSGVWSMLGDTCGGGCNLWAWYAMVARRGHRWLPVAPRGQCPSWLVSDHRRCAHDGLEDVRTASVLTSGRGVWSGSVSRRWGGAILCCGHAPEAMRSRRRLRVAAGGYRQWWRVDTTSGCRFSRPHAALERTLRCHPGP